MTNIPTPFLTPWQRATLMTYDLGDFAYLADATDASALRESLRDCGDSLLRFIISELSANEDCEDFPTAIRRITTARNQLNDLIDDLQEASSESSNTMIGPKYRLAWFIDSDAPTPAAAAREALAAQRRSRSTATVFRVRDNTTGKVSTIDLSETRPQ